MTFTYSGQSMQEIDAVFSRMTATQFFALLQETVGGKNASILLLCAIGRKLFEYSYFDDDLAQQQRDKYEQQANVLLDFAARSASLETQQVIATGRAASEDYARRFGYKTGAVFDIMKPHHVFQPEPNMTDDQQFIRYSEDEAHVVRRLGTAVVSLWPTLPPDVQRAIRQKALSVFDEYQTVQLDQQIGMFIRENEGKR